MPICVNFYKGRCYHSREPIDQPEDNFKRYYKTSVKLTKTCEACRKVNAYYRDKTTRKGARGGIKPKESELVKGVKPELSKRQADRHKQWLSNGS